MQSTYRVLRILIVGNRHENTLYKKIIPKYNINLFYAMTIILTKCFQNIMDPEYNKK